MNIVFVGLGGIGSALIQPVAKFLKYYTDIKDISISMIDSDRVEENNLSRQVFVKDDISQFKANIMAEEFSAKYGPNCKVISHTVALGVLNIESLIPEDSIIFCSVDNYITRVILEDYIIGLKNALCIFGTNNYHDGDVNIVWRSKGRNIFPLYTKRHPELRTDDKGFHPDDASCAVAAVSEPQLIMANKTAAQLMSNAFYSFLEKELFWYETMFDCKSGDFRVIRDDVRWQKSLKTLKGTVTNATKSTKAGRSGKKTLSVQSVG